MYSDNECILQLVALLCAHHVEHVVVCAGSRNAPLAHSLASCPNLVTHPCVDERSGAFEAIGLMQGLQRPVALCVTSGSALLDAAPAVAEAFYQELPLVVISADRPQAWIDQRDGQTIRQPGSLHNFVRREVSLPVIASDEDRWYCNRLINEALLEAQAPVPGPVHINVPLSEPLFSFATPELPAVRTMSRCFAGTMRLDDEARATWQKAGRILVLPGQMLPNVRTTELVRALARQHVVLAAEHLANLSDLASDPACPVVTRADLVLAGLASASREEAERLAPDLVVTLGGHIVSKRLKKYLRALPHLVHWHVSSDGSMPDLFQHLERVFACPVPAFVQALTDAGRSRGDAAFISAWTGANARVGTALEKAVAPNAQKEAAFSDVYLMQRFLACMPEGAALHLANSSPVRTAQFWPLPGGTRVFCNRGVNGIDGSLSAAMGCARVLNGPVFCCIGDLSFFYDVNALWREDLPGNLHILLFNNQGGLIFRTLPGLASPYLASHIAGANSLQAKAVAENAHLAYFSAATLQDFERVLPLFCRHEGSCILEVQTNPELCARAQQKLAAACAQAAQAHAERA